MKQTKLVLFIFTILFFITSCKSIPDKKINSFYLMVYDYESNCIMDVSVSIDGTQIGTTDIYGRIIYPAEKYNDNKIHEIIISKQRYETVSMQTAIVPGQILYFKTGTGTYYAKTAEELFDANEKTEALKMINKALEIEDRKDWRFLKEIILGEVR